MNDRAAMARAIELALKGWGRVAPNPMVGAVLLRNGEVVAEGYHAEFGGPHAEIAALDACRDPEGVTCVVNLEPCAHAGKTPPCADALIAAGVRCVVIGTRDPTEAAGGGLERLRGAGIEVRTGVLQAEAAALNAPFLWNARRPERPFVALKLATSMDGFLADTEGRSQWISGPEARDYVHWLRAGFDTIGVGRRTAEVDDPQLTPRGSVAPRVTPRRVVFSRSGELSPKLRLVKTAAEIPTVLVVVGSPAGQSVEPPVRRSAPALEVVPAADLHDALGALRATGTRSLLIEGGGVLATALLQAQLVDRLYRVQAPLLLGGGVRAIGDGWPVPLADAERWSITERRALGVDTLLVADRQLCLPES